MIILLDELYLNVRQRIYNYFFSDRYTVYPLVLLRVGVALILLLQLFNLWPDLHSMVSSNGIVRQELQQVEVPFYIPTLSGWTHFLTQTWHIPEDTGLNYIMALYVLGLLSLLAGFMTRIATVIVLLCHVAFVYTLHLLSYGVDYFLTTLLFYIFIFPVSNEYAADALLFKKKKTNYTPYVRLLQMHLALVYLISGLAKAFGKNWWNGVSVWRAINRPDMVNFDTNYLSRFGLLFFIIGIATVAIEVFYILFINIRKTRRIWLTLTFLLHLGIALILQLPIFSAVMILFNTCAFYFKEKD